MVGAITITMYVELGDSLKMGKVRNRSIPSLDGLRAFSVLAVILGHSHSPLLDDIPFSASFRNGDQGVTTFFLISGFLITHLLLKELNRDGTISLRRFYLRRTFRIFPPFYAFLIVIAIVGLRFHKVFVTPLSLFVAASYSWDYFWAFLKAPEIWILGHSWSLAVEEQFYVLWPMSMAYFSKKVNLRIAAGVILLSPVSRIVTYFAWPHARNYEPIMLHARLDPIMMGCLLSLLIDMKVGERFTRLALKPVAPVLAIGFLLGIDTYAELRWRGMYTMTIGLTLAQLLARRCFCSSYFVVILHSGDFSIGSLYSISGRFPTASIFGNSFLQAQTRAGSP